ncbi:peptidoglycan-binding protein LysM [Gaopeijia maritima]|uniref:Peptidoglycan-binding protein LysM n=1 Tax=Gaopeijia maritima TaxID=3119007 RepID=A0ABU9E5A4_9BACT
MGIFDFIRNAGKKREAPSDTPAAAPEAPAGESAEEKLAEMRTGNAILRTILSMNLDVTNPMVDFDDGTATIRGAAADQATREKIVLIAGNTQGVSRVDDRMTVEEEAPEARFYTVESGDTLSKIAKEQYGDAMKYPVIFEANKPMLEDPDKIYPGQVLRIPEL